MWIGEKERSKMMQTTLSLGYNLALLASVLSCCCAPAIGEFSVSVLADGGRFVAELTNLRLHCNVSDTPEYIFWYYSAVPQGTDRAKLAMCYAGTCKLESSFNWTNVAATGGTLTVARLARSQDGYYECEAFKDSVTAKDGVRIVVVVSGSPPVITQSPETLRSGDRATLTCSSSGWNPPPVLSWSKAKAPLSGSSPAAAVNLTDSALVAYNPPVEKFGTARSSLILTVDSADDEAVVACTAAQVESKSSSSAQLQLRVQHQPTVGPVADVTAVEGATVAIPCQARGYPAPQMRLISANGSVMQESPNGLFTLSPVDRSQAGILACMATNPLGSASTAFRLAVLYPPTVRTPSTAVANESELVLLPCTVSGNPPPAEVIWRHAATGTAASPESGSADLRLARAEPRLSGEWRCEARALLAASTGGPAVEFRASASVFLTVRYRPGQPAVSQPRGAIAAGSSVNLTCLPNAQSPGQPLPRLRWSRHADPAGGSSPGQSLQLDPVSLADSGVYVCTASNDLGDSQSSQVSLQVVQAPKLASPPREPIGAGAGEENFALACRASANPRPRMRWLRGGVPVTSELYTELLELSSDPFEYQISLHFRGSQRSNVWMNDTGSFQCEAANELGNATVEFQLQVMTKPVILNTITKAAQVSGQPLACQFVSHPGYRVTWLTPNDRWLPGNASANDATAPWRLTSHAPAGPLGNFTCRVENSLGAAALRLELVAATVPDPPSRLTATDVNWDGFRLAWTPAFDGGFPARLRLRVAGWNATAGVPASTSAEADAAAGQVGIGGLYPDTAYTVTCTADNRVGEGPSSTPVTVVTGHIRIPLVAEARWDPAAGRLAFRGVPGYCARVEASADGGATWRPADAAGGCLAYQPEQASVAAGARSLLTPAAGQQAATNLYRVSLCLGNRTDVCGTPFTAYPLAVSGNVPLSTIIIVACVCGAVIIALVTVLIWLCVRRRAAAKAKAAKAQPDFQPHAAGKGSYKQGQKVSAKSASFSAHSNGGGSQHHPAVAFVSPTTVSAVDGRCHRTGETCFDGCDGGSGGVCGSSPHGSTSPQLGTVHLFTRAFYESDATEISESPPTINKQHRKVIYEVVV